jgi:hypothetical protein
MMNDWYPNPGAFLKCEQETLRFLKDRPVVANQFPVLHNDVNRYYSYFSEAIKNPGKENFYFESEIEINLSAKKSKNRIGIANISAEIVTAENEFKRISYNLTIIDKSQPPSRILRKFHFDYDPLASNHKSPHPLIHLQYGGKLSKKLGDQDLTVDHLDIDTDKPRLCYFPLSLGLLINMVLIDFPDEKIEKLGGTAEWRDLIRKNEKIVLEPFFTNCHRFFSNRNKERLFVNDFYYGN